MMGPKSSYLKPCACVLAVMVFFLSAAWAPAEEFSGDLERDDATLPSGEFTEEHTFAAQAGQAIMIDMRSNDFDTYLMLVSPSGAVWENDDYQGDTSWSRIETTADEAGTYTIVATSYAPGETGDYEIDLQLGGAGSSTGSGGTGSGNAETFLGELARGDATLEAGEFIDDYTFDAQAGQSIVIDMRSDEFDTYLALVSPSGEMWENDDHQGDTSWSHIEATADVDGTYTIGATSYAPGETGEYDIQLQLGGGSDTGGGSSEVAATAFVGRLDTNCPTLQETGEFYQSHTFRAEAGQALAVEMTSSDFDTYVILRSPSGQAWGNDDWEGSTAVSRVEVDADASGTWQIIATSYAPGETGAYQIAVEAEGATSGGGGLGETLAGTLARGDDQLNSGEWYDTYTFEGRRGEFVVIDMTSQDFDTYLILVAPEQAEQWDNDDHEGDLTRSQIALELPADGTYEVLATTYRPGETGEYAVSIRTVDDSFPDAAPVGEVIRGELAEGDTVLSSEEFIDFHTIDGRPGQVLRADLQSDEFDTYLIIRTPTGEQFDNDDFEGSTARSFLEIPMTEAGSYVVAVTSYAPHETGHYALQIETVTGSGGATTTPETQGSARLTVGQPASGTLAEGDEALSTGQYGDLYTLDVAAGQSVQIDMTSDDFDTYLRVMLPSGEMLENDDFESRLDMSRIDLTAPTPGRLRIVATSYRPEATGDYQLLVTATAGSAPPAGVAGRQVRGVFVGISDYGGRISNLHYTAEDAEVAQTALQRAGMTDSVLLQDDRATRAGVIQAVEAMAAQCQPGDLFVFFYSGHGGQSAVPVERRVDGTSGNRYEQDDPDNIEETVCFYDQEMVDNDFADMLSVIDDGVTVLVVLDSCFSGGFAKDVVSRPGYIGLFSSPEDVVSMVAVKFEAGGYLAHFFASGVGEQLADDRPEDGSITALELCHYIGEQYREHVCDPETKNTPSYVDISTSRDLGYQQFVSDRGGINPHTVLFAR
jgi:hypothetical protein